MTRIKIVNSVCRKTYNRCKSHYVTNVVDIEKRKVTWNHDGRGKSVLDDFYKGLGEEHCANIAAVTSDGARGFLSATQEHAKESLDRP